MNKWRRFGRLVRPERRALLCSLMLQPVISCALRLLGFRRLQMFLARIAPTAARENCEAVLPEARMLARMVVAANREGLVHGKCLEQSLTLWWLLRLRHMPAELRIGVRKAAEQFLAHAWVELGGVALSQADDVHHSYAAFEHDLGALETHTR
jgi:Transglutaminase-like superfamily